MSPGSLETGLVSVLPAGSPEEYRGKSFFGSTSILTHETVAWISRQLRQRGAKVAKTGLVPTVDWRMGKATKKQLTWLL